MSSIKATLAARNLLRSGGRFWVSLFGIAFATFLMCVQGSLLYSFTLTASRVVDSVQADLWIIDYLTAEKRVLPKDVRYPDCSHMRPYQRVENSGSDRSSISPLLSESGARTNTGSSR